MEIKDIFENMNYGPAPESDKFALEWIDKHSKNLDYSLMVNGSNHQLMSILVQLTHRIMKF